MFVNNNVTRQRRMAGSAPPPGISCTKDSSTRTIAWARQRNDVTCCISIDIPTNGLLWENMA